LKKLPEGAFTLYKGKKGEIYQTKFDLVLIFGSVVTMQFMYEDHVVKEQKYEYALTEVPSAKLSGPADIPRVAGDTQILGDSRGWWIL
jgi:hypothetical protein